MAKQRVVSSNYLGVGLAIATGVAANFGSSLEAQAQVNPNIQTQLNIVSPPLQTMLAQPENSSQMLTAFKKNGSTKCPTPNTGNSDLDSVIYSTTKLSSADRDKLRTSVHAKSSESIADLVAKPGMVAVLKETLINIHKFQFAPVTPKFECNYRQPSTVKISAPFNPTYETNILKSGNNSSPGESAGFGGNVLVTTGVKDRPWDLVALSASEASARYTPNFSPSFDSLTSQAAYQMFLHAYGYDPKSGAFVDNLNPKTDVKNLPPTGLITFDTLAFGYQNQTAFTPTFKAEKADLLTPQVTLGRQNIGLDDLNAKPCMDSNGNQRFCTYANFSITAGQTFSDVKPLQNVNFAASATLGWNMTPAWSLTLPATATAKSFEDIVGGRRDLLLQVGTALNYNSPSIQLTCPDNPNSMCNNGEAVSYTFSLPVTFYKNYSTLSTAKWSGFIVMPTLTFSFAATSS
jgi:hypothetical protein